MYCTTGPTRNDTITSETLHNFLTIIIHLVCWEFTDVLQERLTFTFTVENFTCSTLNGCRMWRGNVHLAVSVAKEFTATLLKCFSC